MAVIAKNCPHYLIRVIDIDHDRIAAWNSEILPIFEPGLKTIVEEVRDKNLFFFSADTIAEQIKWADIIFVSVNTPTKNYGLGAGKAADLQYWEKTARQILRYADQSKIIVEKSTLPVRTAEAMSKILNHNENGLHFDVVSNPEFLAEGSAIKNLEHPDRVLIGGHETAAGQRAIQAIVDIYANWVPRDKIITTNLWSSELSKLVANAFLAQRISSINAISALCEMTEADVEEVARAIGTDNRIGPHFLRASVGFGGSCFKKDILNLVYIAEQQGLREVADYWEQVIKMNDYQEKRFVAKIVRAMFNTLSAKRIALFGVAFKAETSDIRESPALVVCKELLKERANIVITDPHAMENASQELGDLAEKIDFERDPYQAAQNAHAIAVLTEWQEFSELDYQRIYNSMVHPAFIFDGRNLLDHDELFDIGFNVHAIGKTSKEHV
ncbi:nucleotide sugar dehydrogenase [bacterium]|nr:nucleotide sugar dehydrogenase [bacterium]